MDGTQSFIECLNIYIDKYIYINIYAYIDIYIFIEIQNVYT